MDFLKNNARFSFNYGDQNAWDCTYTKEIQAHEDSVVTVYLFEDGLKITNIARKYGSFGAYEWVNWFENIGDHPTKMISDLCDCDCDFQLEHAQAKKWEVWMADKADYTQIYAPHGSDWSGKEFVCDLGAYGIDGYSNMLLAGETRSYKTSGGRSSEAQAPFFNIHYRGKGIITAIGWTGQWNCDILRKTESVQIKSKIEHTHFYLYPGEKFRTASVVVMPYTGSVIESQNQWRRLVKEQFSIIGQPGREEIVPFCIDMWGSVRTKDILERIDLIKKNKVPIEYLWIDAGWYGTSTQESHDAFDGDWGEYTGDWRVNLNSHPDGFREVAAALEDAGLKFMLWFEPERVKERTPIFQEHPEWILSYPEGDNYLLNLGNEQAWRYCFDILSDLIEKLNIRCYRQDFNMDPLIYWLHNDEPDRRGITEIKHINGLYRLWDALLERFPYLTIDNCASGGRRIDIETLRRSVPLWRSDAQCPANYPPEIAQIHNMSFSAWIPYSGTGTGREYDEYRIRSAYGGGLVLNYFNIEKNTPAIDAERLEWLKKYSMEYLRIRPYFYGDIYPLTTISEKEDIWSAVQFDRPAHDDGMIQVFKRAESPYKSASFLLGGIDPYSCYLFTDIDGEEFTITGQDLIKKGFLVQIEEKRVAKIYIYKKIQ